MRRFCRVCAVLLAAMAVFVLFGLDNSLTVTFYTVDSGRLSAPLRLACISDLHSCDYGPGQRELLDAVEAAAPDLVVLTGDILDDELPPDRAIEALTALAARWPCFYVTGNHDAEMGETVAACGITVLDGTFQQMTVSDGDVRVYGVSDPRTHGSAAFAGQAAALNGENAGWDGTSILLAHRPALIGDYLPGGYDLILCGHAHGGQWRLPGLPGGLLAPDEGLFPKYSGGRYDMGGTVLIVSRGLARESTRVPRLYNPPELVIVEIS